jgi:hypothetical protein
LSPDSDIEGCVGGMAMYAVRVFLSPCRHRIYGLRELKHAS